MRITVVGTGTMAQLYLQALLSRKTDPVSVLGRSPASQGRLPPALRQLPFRTELGGLHTDCLVIASTTDSHAVYLRWAVERGVPVYCEKPIVASARDHEPLLSLLGTAASPVWVGYSTPCIPAIGAVLKYAGARPHPPDVVHYALFSFRHAFPLVEYIREVLTHGVHLLIQLGLRTPHSARMVQADGRSDLQLAFTNGTQAHLHSSATPGTIRRTSLSVQYGDWTLHSDPSKVPVSSALRSWQQVGVLAAAAAGKATRQPHPAVVCLHAFLSHLRRPPTPTWWRAPLSRAIQTVIMTDTIVELLQAGQSCCP